MFLSGSSISNRLIERKIISIVHVQGAENPSACDIKVISDEFQI